MSHRFYGALLSVLLAGLQANATPTVYPENLNVLSEIRNPTTSNLLGDNADPLTVYVAPPSEGYGSVTGLHTLNANLLFCSNLQSLAQQNTVLQAKIVQLQTEQGDKAKELSAYDAKIETAELEMAKYATANHLTELTTLDANIQSTKLDIASNLGNLEKCKENCDGYVQLNLTLQNSLRGMMIARNDFVSKNLEAGRVYDQKKSAVDSLKALKGDVLDNYDLIVDKVRKAQTSAMALFTTYGQMEGARASMVYANSWNENIDVLKHANPGLNFAPLPTQTAKVYPGILGVQGLPAGGAVIGFETPGSAGMKDGAIDFPSYPANVTGNVVLSLLGACPMVQPNFFVFNASTDPKNMKYGMAVTYEYPSAMKLKMKATYNLYKFYELIQKNGTSGGFFSSSSWSSTSERKFFHDAYRVDWDSQDPANAISDEQRLVMERDGRAQIMARLASLVIPANPNPAGLISAAAPPEHGAVVVADSLMKACPANAYCVAGAMVSRILDSIFGSSSSSSSMTSVLNVDQEEDWSFTKTVMKPGMTSYLTDAKPTKDSIGAKDAKN